MRVYLSEKEFIKKPTPKEIAIITKEITKNPIDISTKDLASEIAIKGKTVILTQFGNHIIGKKSIILGQKLVMLDFDNKDINNIYTIDDLKNDPFIQENACFYYKTFSDKESDIDKFRVVFELSKEIFSFEQVEQVYQQLFKKYPQSDKSVGQTSRLFFGSNQGYNEINFENKLNVDNLNNLESLEIFSKTSELLTENTPNYLLLKYGQLDTIAKKLGNDYSKDFPDEISALTYYKTLDIKEILELPDGNPFLDILHKENNPSASVFYAKDVDVYYYKCFSDGKNKFIGDIASLISKYIGLKSKSDSIHYLNKMTNSIINYTGKLGEQKRYSNIFRKELMSGELQKTQPELYKYIKKYSAEINATLDIMYDFTYTNRKTGEVEYLNYFSIDLLTKRVSNATNQKMTNNKMWNVLNVIIVTEMVQKLNDTTIPKDLYKNLIEPQLTDKEQIRTSNVYQPSGFTDIDRQNMSEIAKILVDNHVTVTSLSYELVYRLFGEEKAKQDFPQAYKPLKEKGLIKMSKSNENLTKKSVSFEDSVVKIMFDMLKDTNYIYEKDLISKVARSKRLKVTTVRSKYNKIRADILLKYNLQRNILSKDLYKTLNIKEDYSSKAVIYRED